ncbi:sensor histidine kinase [Massilia oculi]|uniref:sensor histidine kinase n=1 Tax=Massilia oculi TaxID=945844 RepID=UPI001E2C323A|nr:sensor histidine kinase [Massilia oculi]
MGSGMALDLRLHEGVETVLEQAIDELRGAYPQARVDSTIAPGLQLRCDPQRLAQMLSNLVRNALTHGDPMRPVEVRAGIADGLFVLAVSNHGPHLDAAALKQLFKPYWRAVSRVGDDGLGLGLYIVDQIARAHGGAIGVQSSQERTTFRFSMPAA